MRRTVSCVSSCQRNPIARNTLTQEAVRAMLLFGLRFVMCNRQNTQEVRRLNQRMMELQQARRDEAAQWETTVSELKSKLALSEESEARQAEALQQVSKIFPRVYREVRCRLGEGRYNLHQQILRVSETDRYKTKNVMRPMVIKPDMNKVFY